VYNQGYKANIRLKQQTLQLMTKLCLFDKSNNSMTVNALKQLNTQPPEINSCCHRPIDTSKKNITHEGHTLFHGEFFFKFAQLTKSSQFEIFKDNSWPYQPVFNLRYYKTVNL